MYLGPGVEPIRHCVTIPGWIIISGERFDQDDNAIIVARVYAFQAERIS